jgi:hypothetical protein
MSTVYAFKNAFLTRLPHTDWMISESDIRRWADDQEVFRTALSHGA